MPSPCRLLSLPPEIRAEVYNLLLNQNVYADKKSAFASVFLVTHPTKGLYPYFRDCNVDARILATCKLVHAEATHYLYKRHVFCFEDLTLAVRWFHTIGASNAQMVRSVSIVEHTELTYHRMHCLRRVFQEAPSLRRLHVYSRIVDKNNGSNRVKHFLRILKPWLDTHALLCRVLSPFEGGYFLDIDTGVSAMCLTFLTSSRDALEIDGKAIDIEDEIAGLESYNTWYK
ncbi:MAG: hypothetical protein Q9209_003623 [Squamulea sp. 1 TL-2023]